MAKLRPTTKAQVSGHKFLMRRVELGLLVGDIRMIHDPIGKRLRATGFGVAAAVLLCVGAGALALLAPQKQPGDVPILVSEQGQLYVRQDQHLIPVPNLTSARLIAGQPATPQKASAKVLAGYEVEQPAGIVDAPGIWLDTPQQLKWRACMDQSPRARTDPPWPVSVGVGEHGTVMPAGTAIFAHAQHADYLVSDGKRFRLPAANHPAGRVIRRSLELPVIADAWQPPDDLLSILPEGPPLTLPELADGLEVWEGLGGAYLFSDAEVEPITEFQAQVLREAGVKSRKVDADKLSSTPTAGEGQASDEPAGTAGEAPRENSAQPDGGVAVSSGIRGLFHLPEAQPEWLEPTGVCVQVSTTNPPTDSLENLPETDVFRFAVSTYDPSAESAAAQAVRLRDSTTATYFQGPGTAVAVATGHGIHVIGEHGNRHQVAAEHVGLLGVERIQAMPWLMLRLLPEGTPLSPQAAAQTFTREL